MSGKSFKRPKKDFKMKSESVNKFDLKDLMGELNKISLTNVKKHLKVKRRYSHQGSVNSIKDKKEEQDIINVFLMSADVEEMQKKIEEMQKMEKEMERQLQNTLAQMDEDEVDTLMSVMKL